MNNRVAFIDFQKPVRSEFLEPEVPLGFLFLSHSLKEGGFERRLFSYWQGKHDLEKFYQNLESFKPKVLALNGTFGVFAADIITLLKELKKRIPATVSIIGGIDATLSPEAYLREPAVDYVCLGEGEIVFLKFCTSVCSGNSPDNIPGICSASDIEKRKHELQVIHDLAEIDLDLELIDWNEYTTKSGNIKYLRSLQSSRGCPFGCNFCYRSAVKVPYRLFPIDRFLNWVAYVKGKTDCNVIRLIDDHFFVSKKHSSDIIQKLYDLDILLDSLDIRMENISDELFTFADKYKVRSMFVGFESPLDNILKLMNKKINREIIDKALNIMQRWPTIPISGQLMLGIPEMTDEDVYKTIDFAINRMKDTPSLSLHFVVYMPFPGSVFWKTIVEKWPKYNFCTVDSLKILSTHGRFDLEWTSFSSELKKKIYGIRELFSLYVFIYKASIAMPLLSPKILVRPFLYVYAKFLELRLRELCLIKCGTERKFMSWFFGSTVGYI